MHNAKQEALTSPLDCRGLKRGMAASEGLRVQGGLNGQGANDYNEMCRTEQIKSTS